VEGGRCGSAQVIPALRSQSMFSAREARPMLSSKLHHVF
jgi:hypothetical protein